MSISKQFEESSRKRERVQRANESLPLTSQADAAFLVQLAKLGLDAVANTPAQKRQVLKTLQIIAEGVKRAREVKTGAETLDVTA